MSSIASSPSARAFVVPYQPIPVPAPAPDPCDIGALLAAQRHDELEKALRQACDKSFESRDGEDFYTKRLSNFNRALEKENAPNLEQIRAWQAAVPESGHAHLIEAHHWYHWAYVYRSGGPASSVTHEGWICAKAANMNLCVAVLRALELDPRLWAAPAIMMQGIASFGEPEWLTGLLLTGRSDVVSVGYALGDEDEAVQQELAAMLAQSGMAIDERLALPSLRPAALPAPVQGKKRSKGPHYWMEAALHIHPRLFFFLRLYIWFLQPRWGGSHDRIRAFVASPHCAHLDAVEKDRLLHEIWRDDHQHRYMDTSSDPEEAEQAIQASRQRAAQALHPYHRYEALAWLACSHNYMQLHKEALEFLKQAQAEHPLDNDIVMQIGEGRALTQEPASTWLAQAVCRSAEARHTVTAQILYGYFAMRGLQGFACDPAIGKAWLDAAFQADPQADHFHEVAAIYFDAGMLREAFDVFQAGHDRGSQRCANALADMYEAGQHVERDAQKAMHYYGEAMQQGDGQAALSLARMHEDMAQSTSVGEEITHHDAAAIAAVLRAHELAHDSALDASFKYIAKARSLHIRRKHLEWVKQHADAGHAIAMAALANILGTYEDTDLYNNRESIRWLMGAQAIAPDDDYVQDTEAFLCGKGWVSRWLYRLKRSRIGAHEIPGTDNAMV